MFLLCDFWVTEANQEEEQTRPHIQAKQLEEVGLGLQPGPQQEILSTGNMAYCLSP